MAEHPITAIRSTEKDGVLTIEALTRTPRGTQLPFKLVTANIKDKSRAVRDKDILTALEELLKPPE